MRPYILIGCCAALIFFAQDADAQYRSKRKVPKAGSTETTQWWIGIKAGSNLSSPKATSTFDIFSFTEEPFADNAKIQYDRFKTLGYQFGFIVGFEFLNHISARIEPIIVSYHYSYAVNYHWASVEDPSKNVVINYQHENQLQYFELPFAIKYELLHNKVKPYVQGGIYWGSLLNATKDVEESLTDNASGNEIFETNQYAGNVENLYEPSTWGLLAGGGCTYNLGNARLGLEVNYKIGMKNISDSQARFNDSQFVSGVFDSQDDLKLNQLEFSLVVVMPLKFITSKDYVPL